VIVTVGLNQNLLHPDLSPFATEAERRAIAWLAPPFGTVTGQICAGSSIANLTALWCARESGARRVVGSAERHREPGSMAKPGFGTRWQTRSPTSIWYGRASGPLWVEQAKRPGQPSRLGLMWTGITITPPAIAFAAGRCHPANGTPGIGGAARTARAVAWRTHRRKGHGRARAGRPLVQAAWASLSRTGTAISMPAAMAAMNTIPPRPL
jgi:hypothetical protein